MKKTLRSIVIVLMLSLQLAGCNKVNSGNININVVAPLNSSEICAVGKESYPVNEVLVLLAAQKKLTEAVYGDKIWAVVSDDQKTFEENLKGTMKEFILKMCTMKQMSSSLNVPVTEGEKEFLKKCTQSYISGTKASDLEKLQVTEEDIYNIFEKYYIYNRLIDQLSSGINIEISDNEARVIQIQSIMIRKNSSDQTAYLNAVLQEAKESNDFLSVAKKYDQSGKAEYLVRRNELETELDQTVFSLASGETSKLVETEDAYYIFHCVSDYDKEATRANKDDMIRKRKEENFREKYEEFIKDLNLRFNDEVWNSIKIEELPLVEADFFKIYNEAQ